MLPALQPLREPACKASRRTFLVWAGSLMCPLLLVRTRYRLVIAVEESMRPTLRTGDLLLVRMRAYQQLAPQRGDVVLAQCHGELIVKRVVGLPGETIDLKDGQLFINGLLFPEPYATAPGVLSIGKGHLLDGKYALLGDNRQLTASQTVAPVVPKKSIVGKVVWQARFPARSPARAGSECQETVALNKKG